MKQIIQLLSLLILLLFSMIASGQTFFKDSTVASCALVMVSLDQRPNATYRDSITIDSIRPDTIYYSLQRKIFLGISDPTERIENYLFKETNNKIFFSGTLLKLADRALDSSYFKDFLLYDFNLAQGDTFTLKFDPTYKVQELKYVIDSVVEKRYTDGIIRTTQFYSYIGSYPMWTSCNQTNFNAMQIGSSQGIISHLDVANLNFNSGRLDLISVCQADNPILECENDATSGNFGSDLCNYDSILKGFKIFRLADINELKPEKLELYPNPTSDYLYLKKGLIAEFELYNSSGVLSSSGVIRDSGINVKDIEPGLYFLKITTKDEQYFGRFIKKN